MEGMRTVTLLRFKRVAKRVRRKGAVHIPRRKRPRQSKDDCAGRLALIAFNRELRTLPDVSYCHRDRHSFSIVNPDPHKKHHSPAPRAGSFNTFPISPRPQPSVNSPYVVYVADLSFLSCSSFWRTASSATSLVKALSLDDVASTILTA